MNIALIASMKIKGYVFFVEFILLNGQWTLDMLFKWTLLICNKEIIILIRLHV